MLQCSLRLQGRLHRLNLQSGMRVRSRLCLKGNLRLRRLCGQRERLRRYWMRQERLGLQVMRDRLDLAMKRRL